jgi:hypothetical protein
MKNAAGPSLPLVLAIFFSVPYLSVLLPLIILRPTKPVYGATIAVKVKLFLKKVFRKVPDSIR